MVVVFGLKVGENRVTELGDTSHWGKGFINVGDVFDDFGFYELVMGGDFFLESWVFLYFLVIRLEEFQYSGRDSPNEGSLGLIKRRVSLIEVGNGWYFFCQLCAFLLYFIKEESVFGDLVLQKHHVQQLVGVHKYLLQILNRL